MSRKSTNRYFGFQFLLKEALAQEGIDDPTPADYRFLLDDCIQSEQFLATALFGKSKKRFVEKSNAKAQSKQRIREQSVQMLRLDRLFQIIYDSPESLNCLEHRSEPFHAWIQGEVRKLNKVTRPELEKILLRN